MSGVRCQVPGRKFTHSVFPWNQARGFTLIELIVVTAIIVVITGVVLVNNNRFGGVVQLENLTYDVALSIRQAQVYGISVQRFGASTFSAGYGAHFEMANPGTYWVFADALTTNGVFDCAPNPTPDNCERVQTTEITRGYSVKGLCAPAGADATTCTRVLKLDVLFKRPEPDAWISGRNNDSEPSCTPSQGGTCYESGRIILASPRSDTMSVVVEANGQISVQRGTQ
ncbi:MAG: hypothetical protein A3E38_00015 [Candidatus Moranbacteria bacterium RIFCSPHIGHO2_12_FULL_54_9]|nr:MAG: hypothetical protein A3E38_00015 [Candidatus Moranbacteria bacterium RIFCSPHIGHO2_12_FULL_54_9]